MEKPNTISALLAKRGEIAGRIEAAQQVLKELVQDLDAVDATIRIFDPDCDLGMIKAKPVPPRFQTFRGEMNRFVLNALRTAKKPITSIEIALAVCEARGINPNDRRPVILIRKRVSAVLWKLGEKGVAREVPSSGDYKAWELIPALTPERLPYDELPN